MHRIYWGAPLVQETCFWCTKWTKRCRWYRKRASGVPTRTRHQCRASGRKLWQNSRCHSWFTFINFGAWHCQFRSKRLLFRVKKWWLYTRGDNPDWSRVRKATFFTRCISPGSSATPYSWLWQWFTLLVYTYVRSFFQRHEKVMRFTLKNPRFLQYIDYQNVRKTEFLGCQSQEIQEAIIPGEKMVVIHPGRHHWLESGAESHFFHPMHKSGIFRHTLSYMITMEIIVLYIPILAQDYQRCTIV